MKDLTTILVITLCIHTLAISQRKPLGFDQIEYKRQQIARNGSISLAVWSGVNITVGTIGYFTQPKNEWTYFQEMNVLWNVINLGLAIPGILIKDKKQATLIGSLKKHHNLQTIYLVNAALDVSYITAGIFLRMIGSEKNDLRMNGYGSSLLLQGGYLMVYDLVQYILLKRNAASLQSTDKHVKLINHSGGLPGIGIRYSLDQ